jgi:hypothetical protein
LGNDVAINDINHCECLEIANKKEGEALTKSLEYLEILADSKGINAECKSYLIGYVKSKGVKYVSSSLIIGINFALRNIIIELVKFAGLKTESANLQTVTKYILFATFFNTGILPMLYSANLKYQLPTFLVKFLNFNKFDNDFNTNWFKDSGSTIVHAMVCNIYF